MGCVVSTPAEDDEPLTPNASARRNPNAAAGAADAVALEQITVAGDGKPTVADDGKLRELQAANALLLMELRRLRAENEALRARAASAQAAEPAHARHAVPEVGDHVIAHHFRHAYYTAVVREFDASRREFVVAWDDGDTSGTRQPFDRVCRNEPPAPDEVGVGTAVMFPQGKYRFFDQAAGVERANMDRYHEGRVTSIERDGASGASVYVGRHARDESDGKWTTYKGYERTFRCELHQLRIAANLLDLLADSGAARSAASGAMRRGQAGGGAAATDSARSSSGGGAEAAFDVYLSHCPADRETAARVSAERACDPLLLRDALVHDGGLRVYVDEHGGEEPEQNLLALRSAKVVVACISDAYAEAAATRQELQYTKKTLRKPVVPVVVGERDEPWEFMRSLVGLLIAGDLYIDMRTPGSEPERAAKRAELLRTVRALVDGTASAHGTEVLGHAAGSRVTPADGRASQRDVFLSYAWANSAQAARVGHVPAAHGHALADPRRVAQSLEAAGLSTWLDVSVLGGGSGLFSDIASGLQSAKVVVCCLSAEYARSENGRMEMQYALKSLKKPAVGLVVGDGGDWHETVVGMLAAALPTVDLRAAVEARGQHGYDSALQEMLGAVRDALGEPPHTPPSAQARAAGAGPQVGDHVISHHFHHAYYTAVVREFDAASLEFVVAWDDGDTTGTRQPFDRVCRNEPPAPDDVGVGTVVMFPQGKYRFFDRVAGVQRANMSRYHEGRVTAIERHTGAVVYVGEHARDESDGKWTTYKGYERTFRCELHQLRVAGNVMAALALGGDESDEVEDV